MRVSAMMRLLDFCLGMQGFDGFLHIFPLHQLLQLGFQRFKTQRAFVVEADDMPAEVGLHRRFRELALFQLGHCRGEFRHIGFGAGPVKLPPIGRRTGVLRLLGQFFVGGGGACGDEAGGQKIAGEGAVRTFPAEIAMSDEIRRLVAGTTPGPLPPPHLAVYLPFNLPWLFAPALLGWRLWPRWKPAPEAPVS